MDAGAHLDDRQQPEVGHQSGAGGGLERGLRAARHTWVLEKQEIVPGEGTLIVLENFEELRERF